MEFQYYLPVNLIFGRRKTELLGIEAKKYGKKAFIVTGRNSTKKTGLLDRAVTLLNEAGVASVIFDQVDQNPLTTTAYAGAALCREEGCDVVIGLGGGSIMDAAKGIAFSVCNEGDLSDYIYARKQGEQALPIILVPTTCGTGSEGNCFAVLTNPENNDKKSLRCNPIIAKASIIDPELMTTMPKSIAATVGFDALCHNMEAFMSRTGQPMTAMMAKEGITLLGEHLVRIYRDPSDMEAWEKVTWASTLGGMVINTAGVTAPHSLEHPASGLRDIVHGKGLAALTPVIFEESISSAPDIFAQISSMLGGRDEKDCVDQVRSLLSELDLKTGLSDQGIREEDVEWMAENCLKVSAAGMSNHPKQFSQKEIADLYRKAL